MRVTLASSWSSNRQTITGNATGLQGIGSLGQAEVERRASVIPYKFITSYNPSLTQAIGRGGAMRRLRWVLLTGFMAVLLVIAGSANGQSDPVDALLVTEVLPQADSTAIQGNSVITIIFNRPIIPLEMTEDTAKL